MEAIVIHAMYIFLGGSCVFMVTNAYKHRNETRMKERTALASLGADQRLLEAPEEDWPPPEPRDQVPPPPQNGSAPVVLTDKKP